jgi:hypothetical protein
MSANSTNGRAIHLQPGLHKDTLSLAFTFPIRIQFSRARKQDGSLALSRAFAVDYKVSLRAARERGVETVYQFYHRRVSL